MPIRLPLSVKILLWFFLNLAMLAVGFLLLLNAQFRFDLNWVFASSARQRVDAVRDLIVGELNTTSPDEWEHVINRFSNAYNVRFSLFEANGDHLLGAVPDLPAEVRARILPPPRPGELPPQPPTVSASATAAPPSGGPAGAPFEGRQRWASWRGMPERTFMRTSNPTHYWLLLRTRLDNPETGGPMRVILLAEANSLSVGGLILDPTPWLTLAIGVVVFSVLFWLPLLRGINRSLGQMTHTTRQIAEGRFYVRVSSRRRDELGALAESINQMAARLDGFIQGQKRFLGDVAHELCSPLARLQMALGIIEQRADDHQKGYVKSATDHAGQIAALVNELLAFSKAAFEASKVTLQPVGVHDCAEEAVRREASENVQVKLEVADDIMVLADSELLVRALANLLRNSIRHGGESRPITISATRDEDQVTISVADSGPGVANEDLPKIFDAFYRVDPSRTRETGGMGLGLTIVKTSIDSCRGSVLARNRIPHGLEVLIRLPAAL